MNELNDYNNNIKYKYNNTICDAVIHNIRMPELYYKEDDIKEKIDENITKYKRNNIELYYNNEKINKIIFKDYEGYNMIYEFNNYEEIEKDKIEEIEEFNENKTKHCPMPICTNVANIIFILDESGSISEDDWIKQIEFCYNIINKYKIDEQNVKIGIIGFSTFGRIILDLTSSLDKVISILDNLKYNQIRGGTCTGCGLMLAKDMIEREKNNNYDRNLLKPKDIFIIITDGDTTEPTYNENCNINKTIYTPYNYCKGCCDRNKYTICENKINNCNITYKNQILEIIGNYNCENTEYNDDNIYCNNCECKIDKDNKKYLVCDECKEKLKNGYNKCYDYLEINICEKNTSISYKKNLTSSISLINEINNLNIISIGVGEFNMEYLKEISKDYSISSYDDLNNILNNIIIDICTYSNLNEGCEINCKGFCGINKQCICPECKENNNNYCINMLCSSNEKESTGCYENNIECYEENKCEYSIKNISNPKCCEYYSNSSNCNGNNKCLIYGCDKIKGCYSINKECDDGNACHINKCNSNTGICENYPNPIYNCSIEYEGLLMVSDCINISKYICNPAVYRPLCECNDNCYKPYYNNETKQCECIDLNIECEKLNNNECLIGTCINGTCKNIENINKTYECQNIINNSCYIGYCNISLGKCDSKLYNEDNNTCDECELKGLDCDKLNNQCEKYKCEVNETGAYCVKYWEYKSKQNECLIDYCDPILGINKTKLNSYVKDCILYNCENNEDDYLTINLCPEFIIKNNNSNSNSINAYKYKCINNTCIKFNNCPLYKDNNKCLIYNNTINDVCNYINVDCNNQSNKCMNYKCNPKTGLCEEDNNVICEVNKCKTSYCDINNGCIYNDIFIKEDKCNKYECKEEIVIQKYLNKDYENKQCVCKKISKCKSNDFCKISYCNIQGKCIFNDYNCEDLDKDDCFNYKCNSINKSCDKVFKIEKFINYCDLCVKKYGNILNINKTICIDELFDYDFNDSSNSSSIIHYEGFDYIFYVLLPGLLALITAFIISIFSTEIGKKVLTSIGGMLFSFFAKKAMNKIKPEEEPNQVKLFYQPKKEFELETPDEVNII